MIEKGMENNASMLSGLINIAQNRINEIRSGKKAALKPDNNARYFAEVVVDLDLINEPMIADPDVNNIDISAGALRAPVQIIFRANSGEYQTKQKYK